MMMRDYAKNDKTKQKVKRPAATRKVHKAPKVASSNNQPKKSTTTSNAIKNNEQPKRTVRKKLNPTRQNTNKTKTTSKSTLKPPRGISGTFFTQRKIKEESLHLSANTKKRITSLGVFGLLGTLTIVLLALLMYVMTHKKTTPVTEINIPKPQLPLSGGKTEIIHIPVNNKTTDTNTQSNEDQINSIKNNTESTSKTAEPKFTFYDSLTNQTVKVDATPKAQMYKYTYMLQVASYKNQNDANAMRARLLLLGLKPNITQKGDYYVVSVGPVNSKRDGDVLKHKLEANKIQGSMLIQTDKTLIKQSDQAN